MKTVKVIRRGTLEDFEKDVQEGVNNGFEIKFSNAYAAEKDNRYYALLIKEETGEVGLPILGGKN